MSAAQDFSQVMDKELDHVRISRTHRRAAHPVVGGDGGNDICNRALDSGLFGLALSGGGIRSATLALGVLQGLAAKGLIRQLDYLSTVSGGGYMGAWLISRMKRIGATQSVQNVEAALTPEHASKPGEPDQQPIHFLRQYSNYLTPRLGFFSADVWTMAAIWFRNTILNLTMLVAFIGSVLIAARILGIGFAWDNPRVIDFAAVVTAYGLGTWMLYRAVRFAPNWTKRKVLWHIVAPLVIGSVFFACAMCFQHSWFDTDGLLDYFVLVLLILYGRAAWSLCSAILLRPNWTKRKVLWRIVVPLLTGLIFMARALWFSDTGGHWDNIALVVILYGVGTRMLCSAIKLGPNWTQREVLWAIVVPLLIGSIFLSRALWFSPSWFYTDGHFVKDLCVPGGVLVLLFALLAFYSGIREAFTRLHQNLSKRRRFWVCLLLLVLTSVVPAFVVVIGVRQTAAWLGSFAYKQLAPWMVWTWGPPAILTLFALGVSLQIGLLGLNMELSAREWLARLRAWTIVFSFSWILLVGGSVYGPWLLLILADTHPWTKYGLTAGWLVTTAAGVFSGKSAKSSGESGTLGAGSGGGKIPTEWVAKLAPFVFMAGFVMLIALGIHRLTAPWDPPEPSSSQTTNFSLAASSGATNIQISGKGSTEPQPTSRWLSDPQRYYFACLVAGQDGACCDAVVSPLWLLVILAGSATLLSFRLDINVFSLHEFYKNRLARCYLGATRTDEREPDAFTGFSGRDDIPLGDFSARTGGYYGPYPLLNATMNVSSGEDLGWQERKSIAFLFSPLYCGYDVGEGNEAMRVGRGRRAKDSADNAYRATAELCNETGIELGTAIAVSGAAANPNQGYHTSTAVAFLMTVFDVRLGWWLANPRRDTKYYRSSPRFNLFPLTNDLFGLTNAHAAYVNLSDGGHFDNMGVYELVRRRCRYIILSDGEQDADLIFGSLTTTIRNCRTDFGVEIKIALDRIKKSDKGLSAAHCVVGTIEYPEDVGRADKRPGYLLYLKSSLTGDEPADVTGYHDGHPEFPHQSTGDQWFTERQFEAYRKLGQHIVESAIGSVRAEASDREEFFKELLSLWHPPSAKVEANSARHADLFTQLLTPFGLEDRLEEMDAQLFTTWAEQSTRLDRSQRESVYRVNSLIQFMYTVYTDLNLESKGQREHPHNAGWLRIFEHWTQQRAFRETWARTSKMYSERFQAFYNDCVRIGNQRNL